MFMNKKIFLLVLCALPITAMEKDMQHIAGSKLVQILSTDIPLQEKINHIHDTCKNKDVDLSEYDRNGIPIFFHAASENSNEAIKIFTAMSQYCKKILQRQSETGYTIAHYAALYGNIDLMHHILNKYPELCNLEDNDGNTANSLAEQFGPSSASDNQQSQFYVYEPYGTQQNVAQNTNVLKNDAQETLDAETFVALLISDIPHMTKIIELELKDLPIKTFETLLKNHTIHLLNFADNLRNNIAHYAAYACNNNLYEYIATHYSQLTEQANAQGHTPKTVAQINELPCILHDDRDSLAYDKIGRNKLHYQMMHDTEHKDICATRELLEKYPILADSICDIGANSKPLHFTIQLNNFELFTLLLEKYEINLSYLNSQTGNTYAHWVVKFYLGDALDFKFVEYLYAKNRDLFYIPDAKNNTAFAMLPEDIQITLDPLSESLECGICLDKKSKAEMVRINQNACSHTVCHECKKTQFKTAISDLQNMCEKYGYTTAKLQETLDAIGNDRSINCPFCRKPADLTGIELSESEIKLTELLKNYNPQE